MEAGSGDQKPGIKGGCGWALFFILALGGAGSKNARGEENGLGGRSPSLQFTVWVNDYAGVRPTMLEGAERRVAAIFREAGIQITWAGGAARREQTLNRNEPQHAERVADIFVGIITSSMANKLAFRGETLGFSLPCSLDESACLAYVFYQRIEELACRSRAPLPQVLACAVAHEIGHLLLGLNSHSERGIMRAEWCPVDFEPEAAARLLFTAAQADLIRVHVREHLRYQTFARTQDGDHNQTGYRQQQSRNWWSRWRSTITPRSRRQLWSS